MALYAGAASPEYITITLVRDPSDASPPDFTTLTAASLHVRMPTGLAIWPLIIDATTTTTATMRYVFASSGLDVPAPGQFLCAVAFTLAPGDSRRSAPMILTVLPYV